MTLTELMKILDYNMKMRVIFEVYGHTVDVIDYRDDILEKSTANLLDMIVGSIKPIWYNDTLTLQVYLKD